MKLLQSAMNKEVRQFMNLTLKALKFSFSEKQSEGAVAIVLRVVY